MQNRSIETIMKELLLFDFDLSTEQIQLILHVNDHKLSTFAISEVRRSFRSSVRLLVKHGFLLKDRKPIQFPLRIGKPITMRGRESAGGGESRADQDRMVFDQAPSEMSGADGSNDISEVDAGTRQERGSAWL